MNAAQGYQPCGPTTYFADVAMTMVVKNGSRLVKRTATGVTLCGDGEYPTGIVFDDVAAGVEVAVYGLGGARYPFLTNDAGNLATIGTWLLPAANGCVKAGTVPTAGFHFVSDSVAADGEIVFAVSGIC